MNKKFSFDDHVDEYEAWFEKFPLVFKSEVEALREMIPAGENLRGIEIGVGTGRTAQALGIKEGVDPSKRMRERAIDRGIEIMDAEAENLPYGDLRFDFVLINFCVSYFRSLSAAFREAYRVLKNDGVLIVGFIERNSPIGKFYELKKAESVFYRQAKFYAVSKVLYELKNAGFRHTSICQTLYNGLDEIKELQHCKPGYGEGSFVVIKAMKILQP